MPLSKNLDPTFKDSLPFTMVTSHFTYFGLKIPRIPKLLMKLSFLQMAEKLKANISKWKLLPLLMIGRINAIKMVGLPQFLYLFQKLPVYLLISFFNQMDSVILSFVWANKPPRISKAHRQKTVNRGSLGLPVLKHYYWVVNAQSLTFWQGGTSGDDWSAVSPHWLKIESMSVSGSSLWALLFSGTHPSHKLLGHNFILKNS